MVSSTGFRKSAPGTGLNCITSMGPRSSAALPSARVRAARSRTSATYPLAVTPSAARRFSSASSLVGLWAMRTTAKPSRPNLRATAAPSPGPAPTMAIVMYPIVELPARPVEALIVPVGEPGADPVEARGWSVLNRVCSRGQCQPRRSAGPVRRTGAVTAAPRARGVVAVAAITGAPPWQRSAPRWRRRWPGGRRLRRRG